MIGQAGEHQGFDGGLIGRGEGGEGDGHCRYDFTMGFDLSGPIFIYIPNLNFSK